VKKYQLINKILNLCDRWHIISFISVAHKAVSFQAKTVLLT